VLVARAFERLRRQLKAGSFEPTSGSWPRRSVRHGTSVNVPKLIAALHLGCTVAEPSHSK
jgi:hypothetical protein